MALEKRLLGKSAKGFLRERLGNSGPLGERLTVADLDTGTAFTFAGTGVSDAQLHEFNNASAAPGERLIQGDGFRMQRALRPSEPLVVQLLVQQLATVQGSVLIAEEGLGIPTDPRVDKMPASGVKVSVLDPGDVFLSVGPGASTEGVAALIKEVDPFFGFAVVTHPVGPPGIPRSLLEADLERIATATSLIVVPAYDGEGYVIWSRAAAAET